MSDINFQWFEYFKKGFVESIKLFDLRKAKISLFNMNVQAKRILEEIEILKESPINIAKLFSS